MDVSSKPSIEEMAIRATRHAATAEAFLSAVEIYVEASDTIDKKILLALLSKGEVMPPPTGIRSEG